MARSPVWIRWFPKDALDGMAQLAPMEELAYRRILDLIITTGDALRDDDRALAWMTKTGRQWRAIRARLIEMGKIVATEGFIRNARATAACDETAAYVAQKAAAVSARQWRPKHQETKETTQSGDTSADQSGEELPINLSTIQQRDSSLRSESESPSARSEPHQVTLALPLPGGAPAEPKRTRRDYDAEFDAWWQHYPNKVAKDAAARAYAAAVKRGATPAELAAGLARAVWPADPNYIPHPSTWLNGGRWKDQPAPRLVHDATTPNNHSGAPHDQSRRPTREYGFTDPEGRRRAIFGALAGELEAERHASGDGEG